MEDTTFPIDQTLLGSTASIDELDIGFKNNPLYRKFEQLKSSSFTYKNVTLNYLVQGNLSGKQMITLHDIGQNSVIGFGGFFMNRLMKPVLDNFLIYHISLPGRYHDVEASVHYPTFDEIASAIVEFLKSIGTRFVIGMGIGAGANILIRSCLVEDHAFEALVLINGYINSMGWIEWLYLKKAIYSNSKSHLSQSEINFFTNHVFGDCDYENDSCYKTYVDYLKSIIDTDDLISLLDSYISRTPIGLERPSIPLSSQFSKPNPLVTITCPILSISSGKIDSFYHTAEMCSHIDPSNCEILEYEDGHGMILDQFPDKIVQAFFLFLQGFGFLRNISPTEKMKFDSITSDYIPTY